MTDYKALRETLAWLAKDDTPDGHRRMFVSLRNSLPQIIAALRLAEVVESLDNLDIGPDIQKLRDAASFVVKEATFVDGDARYKKVPREVLGLLSVSLELLSTGIQEKADAKAALQSAKAPT